MNDLYKLYELLKIKIKAEKKICERSLWRQKKKTSKKKSNTRDYTNRTSLFLILNASYFPWKEEVGLGDL